MISVREIINRSGGYQAIVDAYLARGVELDASTPRKWPKIGIPSRHWPIIIELSKVTPAQLLAANNALESEAA